MWVVSLLCHYVFYKDIVRKVKDLFSKRIHQGSFAFVLRIVFYCLLHIVHTLSNTDKSTFGCDIKKKRKPAFHHKGWDFRFLSYFGQKLFEFPHLLPRYDSSLRRRLQSRQSCLHKQDNDETRLQTNSQWDLFTPYTTEQVLFGVY